MMRLTNHDDQGNWSLKGVKWENLYEGAVIDKKTYERLYTALWRLKDYEDTGLNPDRIEELKERDTAKPPIDIEDNYGFFVCPSCGNSIYASDDFESHKFCLNCGQRILWKEDIDGK